MNKFKKLALPLLIILILTACQSTPDSNIQPTASVEDIQKIKEEIHGQVYFKLNEYNYKLEVTDQGFINFYSYLPRSGGYVWVPVVIQDTSYKVACNYLGEYIEQGMVVKAQFVGRGGSVKLYNKQRCEGTDQLIWN
ncbi:hypothetical protein [Vibrio sagamiensis]|uniref:Lipoprotein n=1 Tax=Vibrio sagamiensis NBRC 104589 TaxID=1219064 RepID=A0A511QED3_9VIBR|nr:hypothetical protein [Vibrio sagamiensis]PNQ53540.1 hypothetical protein C1141_20750 [Vibrio agarivorans]GEM75547.1 hypothetical protein VSA01S_16590 [Vibrio sagamiensis NBRC 104589]